MVTCNTGKENGSKWPFGWPPVLGGHPNGHFVPCFSMRRPGSPKLAKLVYSCYEVPLDDSHFVDLPFLTRVVKNQGGVGK